MAFGDTTKLIKDQKPKDGVTGDGTTKQFDSQWMPAGSGTRLFRPLQEVKDGQLVLKGRETASGKPVYEGGKKSGKQLVGPIPAEETIFMFAWWDVMSNGAKSAHRLMLDPFAGGDINTSKFKNPLWKHIQDNYEKGTRERNAIKLAFALHVYDTTPVMRNATGQLFYPAEDGTWRLLAYGNNGKLIDPRVKNGKVELPEHWNADLEDALENEWATPLNQYRILEGSYGKPAALGGKHLFAQFEQLANTFEDPDGLVRRLGEFDLRMTTTGDGIDTIRAIRPVNRFQPIPDAINFQTRYDLATWTQPWPDEAIQALIDGADFAETVEEYKLELFPTLFDVEDKAYTGKTEKLDPESVGLAKDSEEGLFDD